MSTTFGDEARTTMETTPSSAAGVVAGPGAACPDCGGELHGEFCHACGEKRVDARDLTVKHFATDAMQELTSLDSKLLRTLMGLLFKPGFLTLEWLAGRRNRYLKPLNLCLAIFALSIFAYSAYKPVSTYDTNHLLTLEKSGQLGQLLDKWAARKNITREALADSISEKWQRHISVAQILVVVALALQLQLMFIFARRHFVEHLIFSLHFVSFTFLVVVLLWPVYFFVGIDPTPRSQLVGSGVWVLIVAYLFFAVRAVYRLKVIKSLLVSFILLAGYLISYVLVYVTAFLVALVQAVKF